MGLYFSGINENHEKLKEYQDDQNALNALVEKLSDFDFDVNFPFFLY